MADMFFMIQYFHDSFVHLLRETFSYFPKFIFLISFLLSTHTLTVDVKPSNILVSTRGQVKLCDFGVSRQVINIIMLYSTFRQECDRLICNNYIWSCNNIIILVVFFFWVKYCSLFLIQLVNSIATTYVGTHAYMAVRF